MSNDHFANWGRLLAGEYGGRMTVSKEGVRLARDSERWQQFVANERSIHLREEPKNPDDWRVRLQHVEKRVAEAIISAPVAFSCRVNGTSRRRDDSLVVVRFAFGLSLSLGLACSRRYTAYWLSDATRSLYIAGEDRLFEMGSDFSAANPKSKESVNGLTQIMKRVPEVVEEYQQCELVGQQLIGLKNALSSSIRDLARLYLATGGQYATLLGTSPDSLKGDDAIELEYLNKLEDIVSRFKVSVRFTPLTLSTVRCGIKRRVIHGGTEITLPFVDQPFILTQKPA